MVSMEPCSRVFLGQRRVSLEPFSASRVLIATQTAAPRRHLDPFARGEERSTGPRTFTRTPRPLSWNRKWDEEWREAGGRDQRVR
ncbi:unnamed protein product [Lota lota]